MNSLCANPTYREIRDRMKVALRKLIKALGDPDNVSGLM